MATANANDASSSSGGEESEESVDGEEVTNRRKRDLESITKVSIDWSSTAYGVNPNTNPHFSNKMRLFSRTHHFLGVYPDGSVRGTEDRSDLHTKIELIAVAECGHLQLRGLLTKMYVAMNGRGRVYATASSLDDNTVFIQNVRGPYRVYLSRDYAGYGWHLAIKKSGKMKNGKRTHPKQKAAQFLSLRKT